MISEIKLESKIKRQKKLLVSITKDYKKNNDLEKIGDRIGMIDRLSEEISLVIADFKCQNPLCRSEENLQYHHLIQKKAKKYMDTIRYITARHYFGNIIILCHSCHEKFHKENGDVDIPKIENCLCIKKETIDKIRKRYTILDEKDWIINKSKGGK